jgi:outer membrane PBP1 activator LpoA protein
MNPWTFYDHKPQLLQAGVAVAAAWTATRRLRTRSDPARLAAMAVLAWGLIGVFDYLVYAFGYQVARLSITDTEPIQRALEWLRVAAAVAAAFAFHRHLQAQVVNSDR